MCVASNGADIRPSPPAGKFSADLYQLAKARYTELSNAAAIADPLSSTALPSMPVTSGT